MMPSPIQFQGASLHLIREAPGKPFQFSRADLLDANETKRYGGHQGLLVYLYQAGVNFFVEARFDSDAINMLSQQLATEDAEQRKQVAPTFLAALVRTLKNDNPSKFTYQARENGPKFSELASFREVLQPAIETLQKPDTLDIYENRSLQPKPTENRTTKDKIKKGLSGRLPTETHRRLVIEPKA